MTAHQHEQRPESDDLMALADAVGVTAMAVTDVQLDVARSEWARDLALEAAVDEAIPYELDVCPLCRDTGIYWTTSALSLTQVPVTCPVCPPDGPSDGRYDR